MTRKTKAIAVVTVMVIAAVAAWFVVGSGGGAQTEKPVSSSVHSTTSDATQPMTMLTAKVAGQLAFDLMSDNTVSYRSAWAQDSPPSKAPAGTTLMINVRTFESQQDIGKVNAMVTQPGKSPETWRLLLQFKNGHWLVYAMEEVK